MSEAITDRMIVLARNLNRGLSKILENCYATASPSLDCIRVDKSGKLLFATYSEFENNSDDDVVKRLESDFIRYSKKDG